MKTDLAKQYKEVVPELKKSLGYSNDMAAPRITKIVVNSGVGKLMNATQNAEEKILPNIVENMATITSQKPAITKARKSIAGFKIRQGNVVGLKTTLRGQRMYDFLSRLIHAVFPRLRDFRGISLSNIDREGNLTFGIKEYTVFPEISPDNVKKPVGIQVTIVTTARDKEEAIELLRKIGFPLQKK